MVLRQSDIREKKRNNIKTDNELLEYLKQFYEENGRTPMQKDFVNNPKCPSFYTYQKRFGSWNNAIEMAGLWDKRKIIRNIKCFTDDELLEYLKQFYEENGRTPVQKDFVNNPKCPSFYTYQKRFGSWQKALKLIRLDTDSVVMNGLHENSIQKGRLFELVVLKQLGDGAIDVSGDIFSGPFDGICPKGQIYDAKSSRLNFGFWRFFLDKIVDFYYLGAFDKDYIRLLHVWRIPGDFEDNYINIYEDTYNKHSGRTYKHSIKDMGEYELTGKFIDKFNDLLVSNKDNQ